MKNLIFLGAIISLAIATNALSGWLQSKNGNTYYIETKQRYNWYQAIHACTAKNLSLVTIETDDKSAELFKLLNGFFTKSKLAEKRIWTAGHDNAAEGQYVWITSGHVFTHTNWADGEPNNKKDNEHCVEIRPGDLKWNDVPCLMNMGFMCEGNQMIPNDTLRAQEVTKALAYKRTFFNYNTRFG